MIPKLELGVLSISWGLSKGSFPLKSLTVYFTYEKPETEKMYLLSKLQECLNFVSLFLSASIKKEGLIIVSRRNCVILDDPDILTKQNAPLLI